MDKLFRKSLSRSVRTILRVRNRGKGPALMAMGACFLAWSQTAAYTPTAPARPVPVRSGVPTAAPSAPGVTNSDLQAIARLLSRSRAWPGAQAAAGALPGATAPAVLPIRQGPWAALPVPGRAQPGLRPDSRTAPDAGIRGDRPDVDWNPLYGTPAFLDGRSLKAPDWTGPQGLAAPGISAPGARALAYFQANRDLLRLRDPAAELGLLERHVDGLGSRHESFQQSYRGIPVWNGRITAHFDRGNALYAVTAFYPPTPDLPAAEWKLDAAAAIARAAADLGRSAAQEDFGPEARAALGYAGPTAERNVWSDPETGAAHYAWRVEIRPNLVEWWRYFLDARTGAILEKYNASNADGPQTASAKDLLGQTRTLNTYQVGSTYYLIDGTRKSFNTRSQLPNDPRGALWTVTAGNTDLVRVNQVTSTNNTWTDAAAVSAHYNMARVYEYYLNTFNRNGIDGAGGTMIAAIHVTQGGRAMDNAYFNGKLMAYGDGSRAFKSLARALDVAAHEMTHGVIAATVNLDYKYQSGALNESMADVFGAMVDRDDWTLGEEVVNTTAFPSGAMRNMADPHNGAKSQGESGWQPAHMMEYIKATLSNDNGGVHINDGIPNRACYLIATALGREKTEKIYYRVLEARYLNPGSQFLDMRLGAVRAATDLYGEGSPEVAAVKESFTAVGIGSASSNDTPTPRPPDRPVATGAQYVAYIGAKPGDTTLYMAKSVVASPSDITRLSTTQVYTGSGRPIAVSGDGSLILFVDAKNALRAIDGAGERVIAAAGQWKSVALSPDGATAAATTLADDGKIHLINVAQPSQSRALQLYTPSAGGGQANTVVYADALEFDASGKSIVYDALNRVPQAQGNPIEFWDANLVDIESGTITPFLPTLPEGVSVGNPSFSRTNDLNVVFDLIDEFSGTFNVVAADLFTGSFRVLDSNAVVPGSPRFSTQDDKIVFTRRSGTALNVFQISMGKDKLTPAGQAVSYMAGAQKPVWFVKGPRPTDLPAPGRAAVSAPGLFPEADGSLRLELPAAAEIKVSVHDAGGRLLGEAFRGRRGAGIHRIAGDGVPHAGVHLVRLEYRPDSGPARSLVVKTVR